MSGTDDIYKDQGDEVVLAHQEEREANLWLGGRGARLTPSQKKRIREFCLKRDGIKCMLCGREVDALSLEIDHKDGNAANHFASNLQLVHHSCNSREWNRTSLSVQQASDQCKREKGVLAPHVTREPTSPEVLLNREYEPMFRRYCFHKVRESKTSGTTLTRGELRIDTREYVGCSQQTSYSYFERLFAPNGPFVEKPDYFINTTYVDFRDSKDVNLTVEELEAKYPKDGMRKSSKFELR